MDLLKESLDVDIIVDSRPLTKKEEKAISDFIKADKAKRLLKKKSSLLKKDSRKAKDETV